MTQQIGQYYYVYGAGNAPNREIKFYGDGNKIWGRISGKTGGVWTKIGDITETSMTKEGASTTVKMQIMMEARKTFASPHYPQDKTFDELPYSERVEAIKNLAPTGNYWVTITSNIGSNPRFEIVDSLTFFDPS